MRELSESRKEIDRIDRQLVRLFEERMNVVQEVAAYKKEHHIAVQDKSREEKVLEECCSYLQNKKYEPALRKWMKDLMALSRTSEHRHMNG